MTNDIKIEGWYEDIKQREEILENVRLMEPYYPKAMLEIFDAYHAKCAELENAMATKDYYRLRVEGLRRRQMPNCTCEMCNGEWFKDTGENMDTRIYPTDAEIRRQAEAAKEMVAAVQGEKMEEKKDVKWFDKETAKESIKKSIRDVEIAFATMDLLDAYHAQKAELVAAYELANYNAKTVDENLAELEKLRIKCKALEDACVFIEEQDRANHPADILEVDNLKAELEKWQREYKGMSFNASVVIEDLEAEIKVLQSQQPAESEGWSDASEKLIFYPQVGYTLDDRYEYRIQRRLNPTPKAEQMPVEIRSNSELATMLSEMPYNVIPYLTKILDIVDNKIQATK